MKAIREARISGSAKALSHDRDRRRCGSSHGEPEEQSDPPRSSTALCLVSLGYYPVAAISNTYGVGFLKKRRTSSAEIFSLGEPRKSSVALGRIIATGLKNSRDGDPRQVTLDIGGNRITGPSLNDEHG